MTTKCARHQKYKRSLSLSLSPLGEEMKNATHIYVQGGGGCCCGEGRGAVAAATTAAAAA